MLSNAELDALNVANKYAVARSSSKWIATRREDGTGSVYSPSLGICREVIPIAESLSEDADYIATLHNALPALLAMARECLLARDARPMLDGWRDGLERERNEARAEILRLHAVHDASLAEISARAEVAELRAELDHANIENLTAQYKMAQEYNGKVAEVAVLQSKLEHGKTCLAASQRALTKARGGLTQCLEAMQTIVNALESTEWFGPALADYAPTHESSNRAAVMQALEAARKELSNDPR